MEKLKNNQVMEKIYKKKLESELIPIYEKKLSKKLEKEVLEKVKKRKLEELKKQYNYTSEEDSPVEESSESEEEVIVKKVKKSKKPESLRDSVCKRVVKLSAAACAIAIDSERPIYTITDERENNEK